MTPHHFSQHASYTLWYYSETRKCCRHHYKTALKWENATQLLSRTLLFKVPGWTSFTAEAKATCSNPHISQSMGSIEITMTYHLLSFSWPIGSYVSGSLQTFKFCKISQDSDTHLFLIVMQCQTIKMYDVIDSSNASITSNFETPFVVWCT